VPSPKTDSLVADLQGEVALLRRAVRLTRDRQEAGELVHETFERLFRNRDEATAETHMLVWTHTLMGKLFLDRRRLTPRAPRPREETPVESMPPPPEWSCVSQEEFAEVVDRLPADVRAVFELHALRGHAYAEIAGRLGIARNLVSTRLHQARLMLKEALMALTRDREPSG
jgi:RNA polymerase sigma-70 factor (ECF subfamily)